MIIGQRCVITAVRHEDLANGTTTSTAIDMLYDFERRYTVEREAEMDDGQSAETEGY